MPAVLRHAKEAEGVVELIPSERSNLVLAALLPNGLEHTLEKPKK